MGQSVRLRLTVTHLLVALISVVLVGALSSYLFSTQYLRQRRGELITAAEHLARASEPLLVSADREQLFNLASAVGSVLGGHVCVFDTHEARLLAASRPRETTGPDAEAARSCLNANLSEPTARTTTVQCQGLVYSITAPVKHEDSGELLGLVLVRCPVAGVQRIVAAQRLSTALAVVGAALLAVLLALTASRSFSRPLADISRAAERLAEGDFDVHIAPRGPAEVAMLARTTNWSAHSLKEAFTALQGEREKLADVLVSMSDGVLAYDEQERVMLVNDRARAFLDLTSADIEGRSIRELLGEAALAALQNGTSEEPLNLGARKLRVETARLANGGTVAVIVDVTGAERLETMRREFVANASHQLRAPLTSIRGYLEALSDGTAQTAGQQARCLTVALEQVGLLQRLVDQLLDLSRLQGHGIEQMTPGSLLDVARHAMDHLSPQAASRGVKLSLEADERCDLKVQADPDRLLQAIHNLLDNAIRHSPEGGRVQISVHSVPEGVRLAIADQGPGLDAAQADMLWERFHTGTHSGTAGLGLAITREIVQAHGGSVFARSNPDVGASFGFILPHIA